MIDLNFYTRGDVSNDPLVTSRATRARITSAVRLSLDGLFALGREYVRISFSL